nr:MAG TPA: hypothetical protein [Caudoviricetes sp.]
MLSIIQFNLFIFLSKLLISFSIFSFILFFSFTY